MDREKIKDLLGHTIYTRAVIYARNNMVLEINEDAGDIITARVKGSGNNIYEVTIDFEHESYYCTCPYYDYCKHIGAVLINISEDEALPVNSSTKNIQSLHIAASDPEKVVPLLFNTIKNMQKKAGEQKRTIRPVKKNSHEGKIKDRLNITSGYRVNKNAKQRYRFVLVFEKEKYQNEQTIKPGAQYIKQDGNFGRITKFNKHLITEKISQEEAIIINDLENSFYYNSRANDYIPFLYRNNTTPLFFQEDKNYYEITMVPFHQISITFEPAGVDGNEVIYTPHFIFHVNNNKTVTVHQIDSFEIIGFFLWAIVKNEDTAILLFNTSMPELAHILKSMTFISNSLHYSDIINVTEHIEKKNIENITIDFEPKNIILNPETPVPVFEFAENIYSKLTGELFFRYSDTECSLSDSDQLVTIQLHDKNSNDIIIQERNREIESLYINHLFLTIKQDFNAEIIHNKARYWEDPVTSGITIEAAPYDFLHKSGQKLLSKGYELRIKKAGKKVSVSTGSVKTRLTDGIDWFGITPYVEESDGTVMDIDDEQDLIGIGMVKVGGKYTFITEENLQALLTIIKRKKKGKEIQIPKIEFGTLEKCIPLIKEADRDILKETFELHERLKNTGKIKAVSVPKHFKGTLRPYQKKGYNWLHFLHDNRLGGCLADDMGLGKTIQTLALLQSLKEKKILKPSLIVAPVTTIANWVYEIERFTPKLTIKCHMGQNRDKTAESFNGRDILLTSYQTLHRDEQLFCSFDWYYAILDESQQIKNPKSKKAQTAKKLTCSHRITLTGTPVENSSADLYSQIDFINPGLLGSLKDFQRKYSKAVERHKNIKIIDELKTITTPFILRRKKEDVLKDLPAKEEIIYFTEMGKKQSKIYEKLREEYQGKVNNSLEKNGVAGSTMIVLEALLRLRQTALFPQLIHDDFINTGSCKFEALTEMIDEILQENHKILIFSQFVRVLHIIRDYLDKQNIGYSYIDGSTKKRKKEIDSFQNDSGKNIFLLSIKAGGVGINLTAANYVIIFDPWWNPAVEMQAIDRSHRIGQTEKVTAYRLIVKNTVEEKILELQERKKELVNNLISDDAGALKGLNKGEILSLFS